MTCLVIDGSQGDICREGVGESGAVRGSVDYKRTAVGMSDRQFCHYTQTANIKYRFVSECTVRMLSGWVVASRHSSRDLAHARKSHRSHRSYILRWTVDCSSCHRVL
jgi:hypothetical protein